MEQSTPALPGFLRHHAFLLESTHRDFKRLVQLQHRLRAVLRHQKQRAVSEEHVSLTEDALRGLCLAAVEPADGSAKRYLRAARNALDVARRTLHPAVAGTAVRTFDLGRISVRVNQNVQSHRGLDSALVDTTLENIGDVPINVYGLRFGKFLVPLHVLLPPRAGWLVWIRGAAKVRICFRAAAAPFASDTAEEVEWLLL